MVTPAARLYISVEKTIMFWRAEWRKSHDMSAAGNIMAKDERGNEIKHFDPYHGACKVRVGTRSVRFRLVNRNLVIPEQVKNFQQYLSFKRKANT